MKALGNSTRIASLSKEVRRGLNVVLGNAACVACIDGSAKFRNHLGKRCLAMVKLDKFAALEHVVGATASEEVLLEKYAKGGAAQKPCILAAERRGSPRRPRKNFPSCVKMDGRAAP